MMKLFSNHRNWWSSLTSTFIGSLLGIGITFGITDYIQSSQQRDITRRLMISSVLDIESRCKKIGEKCKEISKNDSLQCLMFYCALEEKKIPGNKISELREYLADKESTDPMMRMINTMKNLGEIYKSDKSNVQSQQLNDIDILNNLTDMSLIDDIKMVNKLLNGIEYLLDDVDKLSNEFKKKFTNVEWLKVDLEKGLSTDMSIDSEFKNLYSSNLEEITKFMITYNICDRLLNVMHKALEDALPIIKQELHITPEDIHAAQSDIKEKLLPIFKSKINSMQSEQDFSQGMQNLVEEVAKLVEDTTNVKK